MGATLHSAEDLPQLQTMLERCSIGTGMLVKSHRGKRLGRVYGTLQGEFWVRPRFRTAPRYAVSYEEVESLKRGEVRLRGDALTLRPLLATESAEPLSTVRCLSPAEQERPDDHLATWG